MLKLLVKDKKGNIVEYMDINGIAIKKIDNKDVLEIHYNPLTWKDNDYVLLSDIKVCSLIDVNTVQQYFRYEK